MTWMLAGSCVQLTPPASKLPLVSSDCQTLVHGPGDGIASGSPGPGGVASGGSGGVPSATHAWPTAAHFQPSGQSPPGPQTGLWKVGSKQAPTASATRLVRTTRSVNMRRPDLYVIRRSVTT